MALKDEVRELRCYSDQNTPTGKPAEQLTIEDTQKPEIVLLIDSNGKHIQEDFSPPNTKWLSSGAQTLGMPWSYSHGHK